ncbi:hypothetical protein LNP74_24660 [Klebsiella pneumoniae subsp. pneumoniae]|nr:hypothetical protein [Klebsiella pneumoniae subsp. pneumoniae]
MYFICMGILALMTLQKEAKTLAGKGYEAPKSNLPSAFRDMKYADY